MILFYEIQLLQLIFLFVFMIYCSIHCQRLLFIIACQLSIDFSKICISINFILLLIYPSFILRFDQHQGNVTADLQMRHFTVEVTTLQVEGATSCYNTHITTLTYKKKKTTTFSLLSLGDKILAIYPSCLLLSFVHYRL